MVTHTLYKLCELKVSVKLKVKKKKVKLKIKKERDQFEFNLYFCGNTMNFNLSKTTMQYNYTYADIF